MPRWEFPERQQELRLAKRGRNAPKTTPSTYQTRVRSTTTARRPRQSAWRFLQKMGRNVALCCVLRRFCRGQPGRTVTSGPASAQVKVTATGALRPELKFIRPARCKRSIRWMSHAMHPRAYCSEEIERQLTGPDFSSQGLVRPTLTSYLGIPPKPIPT